MTAPTRAQMVEWLERQKLRFSGPMDSAVHRAYDAHNAMLDAILAALGEPSGEPVAWHVENGGSDHVVFTEEERDKFLRTWGWNLVRPLYAAAPRPTEEGK